MSQPIALTGGEVHFACTYKTIFKELLVKKAKSENEQKKNNLLILSCGGKTDFKIVYQCIDVEEHYNFWFCKRQHPYTHLVHWS